MDWDAFRAAAAGLSVDLDDRRTAQFQRLLAHLHDANRAAAITSEAALRDALRTHFLDALALAPIIREAGLDNGRLVDVGSGGGFPGIPLKIALPGLDLTLIDAARKKTEALERAVDALGVEARVLRLRAENAGRDPALREAFDLATARALGPWPVVLELALPLCAPGGRLLGQRGADGPAEAARWEAVAAALGGRVLRVDAVGAHAGLDARHVVIVEKVGPTPERYPRRQGIPAKRPLG